VLSVLVEKGRLDVNMVNSQRLTPLHVAVHKGHVECAKRLLTYGCDVNVTVIISHTLVSVALRNFVLLRTSCWALTGTNIPV